MQAALPAADFLVEAVGAEVTLAANNAFINVAQQPGQCCNLPDTYVQS